MLQRLGTLAQALNTDLKPIQAGCKNFKPRVLKHQLLRYIAIILGLELLLLAWAQKSQNQARLGLDSSSVLQAQTKSNSSDSDYPKNKISELLQLKVPMLISRYEKLCQATISFFWVFVNSINLVCYLPHYFKWMKTMMIFLKFLNSCDTHIIYRSGTTKQWTSFCHPRKDIVRTDFFSINSK